MVPQRQPVRRAWELRQAVVVGSTARPRLDIMVQSLALPLSLDLALVAAAWEGSLDHCSLLLPPAAPMKHKCNNPRATCQQNAN